MATALASRLRSPLALFFSATRREDYAASYLLREHGRGRPLSDILGDRYIQNRLSPDQALRLLDRPELVHALGEDVLRYERQGLTLG